MDAPSLENSMAEEQGEDTPVQTEDTPQPIEDDSESGSSDSEEEQVEWLVTSRQKRATAGNRLSALLQQEEDPEDELALLFNEDEAEDDVGFEDAEADQSDVQMDSSSDDEDGAADDDLEGERALQRQEKAERQAKKRKMNDGIPNIFKKRVKIDPTASQNPTPRPKKKSERASWIPTADDAPTRASARGTTRQSKEQLHAQMVDREIKRLKQLRNMEKAAAAKEAKKKPALTQADRLAEAVRVEKSNSKSLSRWEESEMQREAEQMAKLAALKNRHLDGPVITWWSGLAEWVGGKLKQVGKNLIIEEPKEKPATKKRKASEMEGGEAEKAAPKPESRPNEGSEPGPAEKGSKPEAPTSNDATVPVDVPSGSDKPLPKPDNVVPPLPGPSISTGSTGAPVPDQTSAPIQPLVPPIQPQIHLPPRSSVLAPPPGLPTSAPHPPPNSSHPPFILAPPALDGSAPLPGFGYNFQAPRFNPSQTQPFSFAPPQPPPPPEPPAIEHTARNYLILQNFDEPSIKDKNVQTEIIFGRRFTKIPNSKHKTELCAITSYPAKYRDPHTGLAYCNSFAYKEIQRLKRGDYRWSKLVGAYVGQGTFAARGVPPRFTNPLYKPPNQAVTQEEVKQS